MNFQISIESPIHRISPDSVKAAADGLEGYLNKPGSAFHKLTDTEFVGSLADQTGQRFRRYKALLWIGIGGSCLGPKVIAELSGSENIFFIDNVDPVHIDRTMSQLQKSFGIQNCGLVLASKTGSTLEVLASYDYLKSKGIHFSSEQVLVITEDTPNTLSQFAKSNNCSQLHVAKDVGGRFSVLGPMGQFVASYLGMDLKALHQGAKQALADHEHIVLMCAEVLESWSRQEWISVLWIYSSLARSFGDWWVQLWAESLGKKVDRLNQKAPRASSPLVAVGSTDQHSMLQQLMEGARDKFIIFYRCNAIEGAVSPIRLNSFAETEIVNGLQLGDLLSAQASATQQALHKEGVSTLKVKVPSFGIENLGFQFMFWQMVVACLGEVLNIDAFNQPGVELGKIITKEELTKRKVSLLEE